MARRFWIYGPQHDKVGGPIDTERAAAEAVRILNKETNSNYTYKSYPP